MLILVASDDYLTHVAPNANFDAVPLAAAPSPVCPPRTGAWVAWVLGYVVASVAVGLWLLFS